MVEVEPCIAERSEHALVFAGAPVVVEEVGDSLAGGHHVAIYAQGFLRSIRSAPRPTRTGEGHL